MKMSSLFAAYLLLTLWLVSEAVSDEANTLSNKAPYRVYNWIALGDSFSAGPGAGVEYDDGKDGRPSGGSGKCMRRQDAYPPDLQGDEQMPGPNGPQSGKPVFMFVSCTGDTTKELLNDTLPNNQLKQIPTLASLATLSIGGNDVLFGPILKSCILGVGGGCDKKRTNGINVMYSKEFHDRYNQVLTRIIQEKLQWSRTSEQTSLYVTSYIQFFDDWTDQCDSAKFRPQGLGIFAPYITKDLRRDMNHLTHQLNEVLQYKIDLRNVDWTGWSWTANGPDNYFTAVHFVDMDWKYLDHRFCRDDVTEPKNDPDTWFFHLKIWGSNGELVDFDDSQKDNATYVDQVTSMTWTPGQDDDPPFDENDPVQVQNEETQTRTFHPKPDGFRAEAKNLVDMLYEDTIQTGLAHKSMYFMCVGDITSLGEHLGFHSETRFGYIPYLNAILNRDSNFDGPLQHNFIGSQGGEYDGDFQHEIYPWQSSLQEIADRVLYSPVLRVPYLKGRLVVPIMLGAKDLILGRKVEDVLPELHYLLDGLWRADPDIVVLIGTLPMMGESTDNGDEFWPLQRAIIEWNAKIAAMCNYYARKERRPIVKIHISATQKEHVRQNIYIPNARGYQRMAFDWFSGLVQAYNRGFFDGDKWTEEIAPFSSYDLEEIEDTPTHICHQNRWRSESDAGPSLDDITKSLFRDAKDRQDWVENYACNPEWQCKYSRDISEPNMETLYPWSNGTTCVSAGGANVYVSTKHQLLIRRENSQDDMGDWCVDNLNKLFESCVEKELWWGGVWKQGNRLINLTNVDYDDRFRDYAMNEFPNWNSQYGKYENTVDAIRKGNYPVNVP